uniref:Uncharacterized protein n=1 Tax=Timema genevievae TaxID=629358 RepID=A0A7R9K4L6_TIMGE|nr:unnamed protein product [Timema genevievae]
MRMRGKAVANQTPVYTAEESETHQKVNITWNSNHTVSYRQVKRWFFDKDHSNGSLEDNVTTLNVVAVVSTVPLPVLPLPDILLSTAGFVARDWGYFMQKSISLSFSSIGQTVAITKMVGQLLFDGFEDPIINMGSAFPLPNTLKIPYDKFGWFYQRNGSYLYDGLFNIDTGQDDIGHVGELKNWNYRNTTEFYQGTCARIDGTAGELWPPKRGREDRVTMYSTDLCRSISFDYTDEYEVEGILGYRYSGGPSIVDNGTLDPSNECFCCGECVPSGVLNVSSCRFGAPAFISYPHFYQADQVYLDQVEGMKPDEEKHRFYVTLEPNTGIPLDVAARFQVNILLDQRPYISLFKNVPKIFFPMLWFEERAAMPQEMASQLKLLLHLPTIGLVVSITLVVIGLITASTTALCCVCRNVNPPLNDSDTKTSNGVLRGKESMLPLMDRNENSTKTILAT